MIQSISNWVASWPASYGDLPTWLASITATIAIVFGYKQLKQLNTSLRLSSLAVYLQIENEMNSRKMKMLECAEKLNLASELKTKEKRVAHLRNQLEAYLCLYLNGVDRLAFCIRHEYIPETEAYDDYRPYFIEVVTSYPAYFGTDTKYHHVKLIHEKWNTSGTRLKSK